MSMYPQKVMEYRYYFFGVLKVTDKKGHDPDPIIKGTDPGSGSFQNVTDPEH